VSVVVDEGHDEERKKGDNLLQSKKWGKPGFRPILDSILFMLRL
jgi:hypothetical protein